MEPMVILSTSEVLLATYLHCRTRMATCVMSKCVGHANFLFGGRVLRVIAYTLSYSLKSCVHKSLFSLDFHFITPHLDTYMPTSSFLYKLFYPLN